MPPASAPSTRVLTPEEEAALAAQQMGGSAPLPSGQIAAGHGSAPTPTQQGAALGLGPGAATGDPAVAASQPAYTPQASAPVLTTDAAPQPNTYLPPSQFAPEPQYARLATENMAQPVAMQVPAGSSGAPTGLAPALPGTPGTGASLPAPGPSFGSPALAMADQAALGMGGGLGWDRARLPNGQTLPGQPPTETWAQRALSGTLNQPFAQGSREQAGQTGSGGQGGFRPQGGLLAQFFDEAANHARAMKLPPPKPKKITQEERKRLERLAAGGVLGQTAPGMVGGRTIGRGLPQFVGASQTFAPGMARQPMGLPPRETSDILTLPPPPRAQPPLGSGMATLWAGAEPWVTPGGITPAPTPPPASPRPDAGIGSLWMGQQPWLTDAERAERGMGESPLASWGGLGTWIGASAARAHTAPAMGGALTTEVGPFITRRTAFPEEPLSGAPPQPAYDPLSSALLTPPSSSATPTPTAPGAMPLPTPTPSSPAVSRVREAALSSLYGQGLIDERGHWTPLGLQQGQAGDLGPILDANGRWTQHAVDSGIVPPEALGRTESGWFGLGQTAPAPAPSDLTTDTGAALVDPNAPLPVTAAEVIAVESGNAGGGGGGGGGSRSSGGSRSRGRASGGGGGGGFTSGSRGSSRRSRGGGFSFGDDGEDFGSWEDFLRDFDDDGDVDEKDERRAKMEFAKRRKTRRGKRGGKRSGNLPQMGSSPIRQQILGNLSEAFGRPVGGWPEGM